MSDRHTPGSGHPAWAGLRQTTSARIGLGRAGDATPTRELLDFAAAHAAARDAVHVPLAVESLLPRLRSLGLGEPAHVPSAAPDRRTYLTRPDLGRVPGGPLPAAPVPADRDVLAVVLADGLSAEAVDRHAIPLLEALLPLVGTALAVAPPVLATQARVALGDHVGAALAARVVLVLVGERPGLSSHDSLGAYLTYGPVPGTADSSRNCVSNIRPPHGLGYDAAARTIAALIAGARSLGATGVGLKDTTAAATHEGASALGGPDRSGQDDGHHGGGLNLASV